MSIDLSLERIQALLSELPYTRPTIHIAGTNGKGSVACLIASILRASSFTVGKFNSPHLVAVHDCIVINEEPVAPELYHARRSEVEQADARNCIGASSFELLTMTALLIFEKANVDVAVMEVGMGGRLDATNVIPDESILASVLTAVDLDHQAFLGDTVELIAREKAGITRRGKPFVVGPQTHPSVVAAVKEVVYQRGGVLVPCISVQAISASPSFSLSARPFVPPPGRLIEFVSDAFDSPIRAVFPLHGTHQLDNLSVALTVVSTMLTRASCRSALTPALLHAVTAETVRSGLESACWPGRLSFHTFSPMAGDPLIVLVDGAHNPASAEALASYVTALDVSGPRTLHITYILALSHSPPKTPLQTLSRLLLPHSGKSVMVNVAALRFTSPEGMPWVKSVAPSVMRETVVDLVPDANVWSPHDDDSPVEGQLEDAFRWTAAKARGSGGEHLVVLAGSLYLVADFYRLRDRNDSVVVL